MEDTKTLINNQLGLPIASQSGLVFLELRSEGVHADELVSDKCGKRVQTESAKINQSTM